MKRQEFNLKQGASLIRFPKLALIFMIMLALDFTAFNANAQRHGGSGRGSMGFSGGGHLRQDFGHINNTHVFNGNFGYRGHFGNRYYGYRGIPYWRYSYFPFWGDYYWDLPPYAFGFYLNGFNYYDCDGIYYKKENDKYQVVPAPVGYSVKAIPKGSLQFTMDGVQYFYYFGSYYVPRDGKYEVVEPPIGAEVDSIPDGYEKVTIDGQTYFTLNGVQYKAVIRNNVVWYRVIKSNGNNTESSKPATSEQSNTDNNIGHN